VRNWDYRFCWLRDATFTLLAFMNLGYYQEAQAWRDWLIRVVAGSPSQVQIMYGVGGERWLPELIVPWLSGYENSSPVRIGNGASQQLQLDVFGEIADAMFQAPKAGVPPSERGRALRPVVLNYLGTAWRQPDEGLWEVRGRRQHFVHSKVMAWVAFDRAANELEPQTLDKSGQRWREIANEIHAEVCDRGFDRELNSFVQTYGSTGASPRGSVSATMSAARGTTRYCRNSLVGGHCDGIHSAQIDHDASHRARPAQS
jgi:GH15 family glucan-1,4-alpha-glucosidase